MSGLEHLRLALATIGLCVSCRHSFLVIENL